MIRPTLRAYVTYLLTLAVLVGLFSRPATAQTGLSANISLNHDTIVAGQPLLLDCKILGKPEQSTLQFKDRDKGWINVRLLNATGREVGTFDSEETRKPMEATQDRDSLTAETATPSVSAFDEDGLHYSDPILTSDDKIRVPQTNAITKPGVYRLLVRVRYLVAVKPYSPNPATLEEEKAQEPKIYRPIKASAVLRVTVTSADPVGLAQKAAELRQTITTKKGPEVLQSIKEIILWPSDKALTEWRLLARSIGNDVELMRMFAFQLAQNRNPSAIQFLGDLAWNTSLTSPREALFRQYYISDPQVKKQIGDIFAAHGEELPKGTPMFD